MPGEDVSDEEFERWALSTDDFELDLDRLVRFLEDVRVLCVRLLADPDSDYMTHFYDAAKETFDGDKTQIRTWFTWLYLVIFQRPNGPRWGEFVKFYGVENFVDLVENRFANLAGE